MARHLIAAALLVFSTGAQADLTATFNAASDVPLTASSYTASGDATFTLNFAPEPGTNLTVVKNTGLPFIQSTFSNLTNGATVNLSYNGTTYPFIAWYYGGSGNNDLVLLWPYTGLAAWGYNISGQLGNNTTTSVSPYGKLTPVAVDQTGVLEGKTIVQVVGGQWHTLALTSEGRVYAWGENTSGQLGDNDQTATAHRSAPVAVNTASGISALFGKTVVVIAAGGEHSLALCSDGTLVAWGSNTRGQLGDNTMAYYRKVPVAVNTASGVSALFGKTVVALVGGFAHSLALCSDGTVVAWGFNHASQLGDNTTTQRHAPVAVNAVSGTSALFGKTVVALAAGEYHNLVLCSDGTLATWGSNQNGQSGDNTTAYRPVPVAVNKAGGVSALFGKTVVTIGAGLSNCMALCSDGTAVAWGDNQYCQLGDNTTTQRNAPVAVNTAVGTSALFGKTVVTIATGRYHSLALCSDGMLAAWGSNSVGELGDNSTTNRPAPVVVNTTTGISVLAGQKISSLAGVGSLAYHSLAIYGKPLVEIAISGNSVEIANDDSTPRNADNTDFGSTFLTTAPIVRNFTISSIGHVALNLTGTPKVVIGGPHATDFTVTAGPASPVAPFTGTTTFEISFAPSALGTRSATVSIANDDSDKTPYNFSIQGAGVTSDFIYDAATDVPVTASSITASGEATFTLNFVPAPGTNLTVIKNTGPAFIQGTFNNLANGATVNLSHNGTTYPFIAWYYGGNGNDLVLLWPYTGLAAWGRNQDGQLGDNSTTQRIAPVAVDQSGLLSGKTIVQVVQQQYCSMALTSEGQIYAWGANIFGQLGDGTTTQRQVPVAVNTTSGTSALFGKTVVSITAGWGHSLALCSDGTLAAWGHNYYGQLGDNTTTDRYVPVAVNMSETSALFGKSVVDIAAGSDHSLALCSDGTAVAWGRNTYGQLGDNTTTQRNKPVAVITGSGTSALFGKTVVALSAGQYHSMALCSDGTLAAWGYNNIGQLGNNSTTQRYTPAAVNTDSGVSALFGKTVEAFAAGNSHSLALCTDGTLVAWGYNGNGEIGDNTTIQRLAPVAVNNASGISALFGKKVVALSAGNSFSLVQCSDGTLAAWGQNDEGQLGDNTLFNRPVPVAVNTAIGASALAGQKASGLAKASSMANHSVAIYGAPLLEIAVSGNSVEIAHGDAMPSTADHTDFGGTNLTGGSVTRAFTITNRGLAPLNLTGTPKVVISGTHAADFTVTTQPVTPVAFTGTTTFQITFDPSALGIRSATLTITNDDADENQYSFGIQGTGSEPEISMEQPMGANLAVGGIRNFGPVPVGSTKDLVFTIKNTGGIGSNLTDLGITLDGADAGEFSLVSSPTAPVVGPSGSTNFIVHFAPTTTGTKSAALHLASNDSDESPFNIQLTGTTTTAVSATFSADSDVGTTLSAVNAAGLPLNLILNYAPTPGTNLTAVKNTGPAFIQGIFNGVANGATLNLTFNGNNYPFIAWYYGGDGNDLVLLWPYTALAAWGNNQYGELGDNTTTQRSTPVAADPSGALAGKTIVQVVRGRNHTLALTSEGRIYAWGDNFYGQLGDNTMIQRLAPVEVNAVNGTSALFGKIVVAIAVGDYHSLALCSDGTAVAWGYNNYGQLGDSTATQRNVPVAVNVINGTSALFGKTVVALDAGSYYSLVLCSDGTLAAWGNNLFGQLGDTTTTRRYAPVLVNASSGNSALFGKVVVSMTAGAQHSLALCSDGTLVAWGWNSYGQLGDTTTTQRYAPVVVNKGSGTSALFGKNVTAIAASSVHSMALCSDGTLAAWGYNFHGQLGDNTTTNRYAPVEVNAGSGTSALFGKTVVTLATGALHSMALCSDGTMAAWGDNFYGQLGDNTTTRRYAPVAVNTASGTSLLAGRKASGLAGASSSGDHSLAIYGAPQHEIAINGNGVEIADGDTTPSSADHTDFGGALLTAASVVRTFTITSSGLTALNLTGTPRVVIGGPHAADFTVTTQPISPVAPFIETSTFQITFDPSALGIRSATVSIASDDSDENPYTFSIQGVGGNASAPSTTTTAATGITFNGAMLNGKVNANKSERTVFFDYGITTNYGSSVVAMPGTLTGTTLTNVTASITGLQPHTKYNFRVRAAGPLGAANGANMTFTTLNRAPVATGETVLALPSAKVTIPVLSNDADPDGDVLSIAAVSPLAATVGTVAKVGTDLVFTPSATFAGGSFTYTASDALGLKSNAATVTLQLAACTLGADVTIPADSPPYDLTVSATAPWTVIESLSWLSFVPSAPGATSVRFIPAPNPSKDSRTGTVKIGGKTHTVTQSGVLVAPVLTTPAPIPNAAISANYDLIIPTLNGPVTYTTTGMPKGLTLSNVTGHITGYPTEAKTSSVMVKAKNVWGDSNSISFDITVLPFPPALVGSYSATIADSEALTDKLGGLMTMTVTNTGGVTGTLKLGAGSHSFTGRLNTAVNPLAPDPDHAVLKTSVKRTGKPAVDLTVNMNSATTDLIAGDVTLPGAMPVSAMLSGSKHVWHATTKPADLYKGYFTTALEPTDTSANIPQGDGFLTFSVSAAGAVSWSGQLADGTIIPTQSATLWASGDMPLFALLYGGKGSLNQKLSIASGTKIVSGSPHWHKKPQTARAYAAGFDPTTLTAVGAEYLPPGVGQTLLNIGANSAVSTSFSGGGISSVGQFGVLEQTFIVNASHVATPIGEGPVLMKITKLDVIKGTFTGSLTLKDNNPYNAALPQVARPVTFNGVLLPASGMGTGYFLLPGITGPPANVTTSPMTSGRVRIMP